MTTGPFERHQLAGWDARERGFSRPVEFEQSGEGVRAVLRYETSRVVADVRISTTAALEELVRLLHDQGYSQLKSQQSYRNGAYLGSQEPWIEYPDPERRPGRSSGFFARAWNQLRRIGSGPQMI
ncbi:MAG: hypothetical protein ACT4OO_12935 [Nitrospiraceae bacterium]